LIRRFDPDALLTDREQLHLGRRFDTDVNEVARLRIETLLAVGNAVERAGVRAAPAFGVSLQPFTSPHDTLHMQIRSLDPADFDDVRQLARESLSTSYGGAFDDETIDAAVARWYSDDALSAAIEDDDEVFLVATDDGDLVGFCQALAVPADDEGRINWVHVDPDSRGLRIASQLFERAVGRFEGRGLHRITGRVLAEFEPGVSFYEDRGFQRASEREVTIGEETFTETVYVDSAATPQGVEAVQTPEGRTVYVDREDDARGSGAPFYAAYSDEELTERYGWYCSECGAVDTAMDTMGRVICNECGNHRKPTRWDASYL
jgi:ribosomal protein S18 acetylase RimI-like enzyme